MTFEVNVITQFKTVLKNSQLTQTVTLTVPGNSSTEVCSLVESKNNYTKACSDDLSSFIFMDIETAQFISFIVRTTLLFLFPSNVNDCSRSMITRLRPSLDIVLPTHRTQLFRFGAVKAR